MKERLLTGYCPKCGGPLEVYTEKDRWPLIVCECGWQGGVPDVRSGRVK